MDDQQRAMEFLEQFQRLEDTPPELVLMSCDRVLEAITAALRAAPEGFVMVRKEAIDWLNGETEEGFECPPDRYFRGEPPRYWWRSVFREKAGLTAARPQGVKDGR